MGFCSQEVKMIKRYSRDKMSQIWSLENRFNNMLKVEVAVAKAQSEAGIIPKKAALDISKNATFKVSRIAKIEEKTKHDVIAFVTNLAENVGPNGRYIHYGMTSSDVLDTALCLQIRDGYKELELSYKKIIKSLKKQVKKYESTICTGRTHGMHAEPTTFGLKLCGHLVEMDRHWERVTKAYKQIQICKLSGAVGTFSSQSQQVEQKVAKSLKLKREVIATQVIPRDRHAELICAISFLGAGLERLAIELRHLQRTEVAEVHEGFSKGQKGSSAMPHKKNPISSENITGVARLLRSYVGPAMENIALWHERDISHSSAERVIMPDAFILADYALNRMAGVVENLVVDKKRMIENMNLSQGQIFSSHLLLALVDKGLKREDAYKEVQSCSHSLKPNENLKDKISANKKISNLLSKKEIEDIFSGKRHLKEVPKVIKRALKGL